MSQRRSLAVLSPSGDLHDALVEALEASGTIQVVAHVSEPEELEAVLHSHPTAGLYVDLDTRPEKQLDWIEALREPRPPLLMGGPADPELILRAMRLGALRFFPNHELDEEIDRLLPAVAAAPATAPGGPGKLLTVLGAKGGVGTTTVACELACHLQAHGGRVAVVDAKLHFGDVALHFDVRPTHSLADVALQGEALDSSFMQTIAHLHESGVNVVAAPHRVEDADGVEPDHVTSALGLLREDFDWVIVDLPRVTDEVALQTLDLADQILLVTTLEIPSLARARQILDLLGRLGHGEEHVRLLVNRDGKPGALSEGDPLDALGMEADAFIPDDQRNLSAAMERGRCLRQFNSRSPAARAYQELALHVHDWCEVEHGGPVGSAGILGRVLDRVRKVRCHSAQD